MKGPKGLKDWQQMFGKIYGRRNQKASLERTFLKLVKEIGDLAKALRQEDRKGIANYLASSFAWLIAVYNRLPMNMKNSIWSRFPGICPYCFNSSTCSCVICGKGKMSSSEQLDKFRRKLDKKPKTLDKLQKMFKRIYGDINRITTQTQVGLHIIEELGEVAEKILLLKDPSGAILIKCLVELEEELADIFAWICALANKTGIKLSTVTWKKYPGICWKCEKKKCECR